MKTHRDTFYFPHACRRDHRAHTVRLLAGFVLVFLAALLLPSPIRAGEIEADVINDTYVSFWTAIGDSDDWPTSEVMQASVDDAYELWQDTTQGSHCENYAAAVWVQAQAGLAIAEDANEMAPITNMALWLDDVMAQFYNNCAEEA